MASCPLKRKKTRIFPGKAKKKHPSEWVMFLAENLETLLSASIAFV